MAVEARQQLQGRVCGASLWPEGLLRSTWVLDPAACRVGAAGEASGGVRVRKRAYLNVPYPTRRATSLTD